MDSLTITLPITLKDAIKKVDSLLNFENERCRALVGDHEAYTLHCGQWYAYQNVALLLSRIAKEDV